MDLQYNKLIQIRTVDFIAFKKGCCMLPHPVHVYSYNKTRTSLAQ